jgi:excisionase family DNA binding protein
MQTTDSNQLVKAEEVAKRLDVGLVTVKRLAKRGELQAIRLGHNTVRFRLSDVEKYIEAHKV